MDIYSSFETGDMLLLYYCENGIYDFTMIPKNMKDSIAVHRTGIRDSLAARSFCRTKNYTFPALVPESMIQFKISGTPFEAQHANGTSMRNAPCTKELKFLSQEKKDQQIITRFEYRTGLFFDHVAELHGSWIRVYTTVRNTTCEAVKFDYFAGFSLGMLSPFQPDDGANCYFIERVQSHWAEEGRHEELSVERAGLEMSWQAAGVRSVRYGQRSTMPVKDYFPFAGFEDRKAGVLWGVQLECCGAWQLEFTRFCDVLNISGGQPDREFSGWTAYVKPGESMESIPAVLTCVKGDILDLFNRLTDSQKELPLRKSEEELPPMFNEFCTTWGDPSPQNLERHLEALKGLGLKYFILDDGWFYNDGIHGKHGDWILNESKYNGSFDQFLETIRKAGMIPGIWFELDIALDSSFVAKNHPEYFVTLDHAPVNVGGRMFLDLRKEAPRAYLRERVIGFLKQHNIGYMKVDYNASFACGCDGEDSPLENQRKYTKAVRSFYDEIRAALPDLVIELCASGGHRLSPAWLRFGDLASFSDAHECPEIPMIALDVQMLCAISKSQIWAVLRKGDGSKRLHYTLSAALLGRMCLSGDPADLTPEEMSIVKEGVEFYRTIAPLLKNGSFRLGHIIGDYRSDPTGWQMFRRGDGKSEYVVIHTFRNAPEKIIMDLKKGAKLMKHFASETLRWEVQDGKLVIHNPEDFEGAAFLFG